MQLQALWIQFPASRKKRVLGEIIKDAGRCSTEARQSLWGLRALGAESLSFSESLARLSRQAVAEKPISLSLKLEPVSLGVMPEVEYQLLRIAQEAYRMRSGMLMQGRSRSAFTWRESNFG